MELLTIKLKKLFSENINNIFGADYAEKVDIQNSTKKEFGDFQTNFAMVSSKLIGKNPREIANTLLDNFTENDILEVRGRHDPIIVPRVVPVLEAATAIVILDRVLESKKRVL